MHLRYRAFQILKQRFYPLAKKLPYRRKLQISAFLHKQIHPKLLLQLMNLAAYRRLGHMQLLSSFGNMLFLGNLQKILQLSKFHFPTSPIACFFLKDG
ncbi:hypothetical protein D3C80_1475530 [compost metagenome]